MMLNETGRVEFIQSNFHPYFDIELSSDIIEENVEQFVNFVLPISTINEQYAIDEMQDFFNEDFNNVVFTSTDDKHMYKYECYQKVYFIRMEPFRSSIRMHILPKKYNASNTASNPILIFKDNKQNIDENNFNCTDKYERHTDKNNINLYYKNSEQASSNGMYKFYIKDKTKDFRNLQINLGYSYNDTNPTNPMQLKHYTGILDESDQYGDPITVQSDFTEFNLPLIDANYDNVSTYTNTSKQQRLVNHTVEWPNNTTPYDDQEQHILGFNNPHNINTLYHKTIKYFNGDIYIEENNQYLIQRWTETRS